MSELLKNRGIAIIGESSFARSNIIVVVGVARGGTSMVAGSMAKLGIFMGDKAAPPVFEDMRLSDSFERRDLRAVQDIVQEFEPRLSDKLRQLRDQAMLNARERRILVYGRPSVPRNAFQIIVEGLRHFISTHPDIDWTFVSAGEAHPPIELGMGRLLNSVGKLTIEQYAQELGRSSIGISLMISPHPSYPPLEMATFGMHVLTNRYKSKDLSVLAPNIHSLDEVSPQALSERLATLVSAPLNAFAAESLEASSDFLNNYLNGEPEFNRLSKTIRAQLL